MARFSRLETLNSMIKIGLVPVFYTPDIEKSKKILKSCYDGGAVCIEMTNRGDHAIDIFCQLEKYSEENFPNAIFGVGSIIDAPTAAIYISHGANFIVGPTFDKETAILCNKRKIPYMPGCASATEIQKAHIFGVEICKVFPGKEVGGPSFVKAMLGPCPWTSIMPTGGVDTTKESLYDWFSSGVSCVGIGSKLITKEIIKKEDYNKLTQEVKRVIDIIREIKESLK